MEVNDILLIKFLEKVVNSGRYDPELGLYFTKEQVAKYRNMKLEIYPNDHPPAHFHVKSRDKSIDAKFRLDSGEYMSGKITNQDKKAIFEYYNIPQVNQRLFEIWEKFHGDSNQKTKEGIDR
ncbi:MAG: hypothetical protein CVU11_14560 [Bacteroidetes bacterium HGW-Bacteroidetes-6]|jgi:hypothetical protein|nr:MAG: hypothetical protein CVU11_14560 [Bacteroidetes bacterium HGW-Bacteroidetes-6]